MNGIARWGIAALMALLVLAALFTPQHVTPSHTSSRLAVATDAPPQASSGLPATPGVVAGETKSDSDDTEAIIDLYGNEVSPAIATYSFDSLGSLYEVHSPQTELPKLGSPKT